MASLPLLASPDPTLQALDRELERRAAEQPRRNYLGFSSIGRPFEELRRGLHEPLDAFSIKLIESRRHGEAVMAERLQMVPSIQLLTRDPQTGEQFEFSLLDGRYKGQADGLICGLLHDPDTWHVWEHKVTDENKQHQLAKLRATWGTSALSMWDATYYAEAVMYMHASGLTRHYLTCSSPGERSTASVVTRADPAFAEVLIEKARKLLEEEPVL